MYTGGCAWVTCKYHAILWKRLWHTQILVFKGGSLWDWGSSVVNIFQRLDQIHPRREKMMNLSPPTPNTGLHIPVCLSTQNINSFQDMMGYPPANGFLLMTPHWQGCHGGIWALDEWWTLGWIIFKLYCDLKFFKSKIMGCTSVDRTKLIHLSDEDLFHERSLMYSWQIFSPTLWVFSSV
jgi:hypothetical protein